MNIRKFSISVGLAALCLFISYGQTAANAASLTLHSINIYATPDDGSYTGTRTLNSATGEVISESWTPSTLDTAMGVAQIRHFITHRKLSIPRSYRATEE